MGPRRSIRIARRRLAPLAGRIAPILVLLALVAAFPLPGAQAVPAPPPLIAYRGLGAWVDIFDTGLWSNPDLTVRRMQSQGVRTLFLETSNYSQSVDIVQKALVARFVQSAHAHGLRIVAWYLPSFNNLGVDLRRSLAPIDFRTSDGQHFDSFGLDIEASVVHPPSLRSSRLLTLSQQIRSATGPSYPLGAIIPAPRGMQLSPTYWPGFPYASLAATFDVFVPMGFFSYHTTDPLAAYRYTVANVEIIRRETGVANEPIHVIGGIADRISTAEVTAFLHAVRSRGVLGASLYDFATTNQTERVMMSRVRVNPAQSPALPVDVGYTDPLGRFADGDQTHPKEVFYRMAGGPGDWILQFDVRGIEPGELNLVVNWRKLATVAPTAGDVWSGTRTITIPDARVIDHGVNLIAFVAAGDYPAWSNWGVQGVAVSPGL
jgi:hypothetical protein